MPIIGLEPGYPPPNTGTAVFTPRYPTVDSLQPTLRWESFPRDEDVRAHGQELMRRVGDVSYDLRIWRSSPSGENCHVWTWVNQPFAGGSHDYVYSRDGLSTSAHRIEMPLVPSALYCWTVSARFSIDGHPRDTEWSRQRSPVFREEYAYGFRAPSK